MADEKADEKGDEKTAEKSWDEKWGRDPVSTLVWAGILIWAGLVFLADNIGILERVSLFGGEIFLETWALIFLGAGLLVLLGAAIRLVVPAYRRPVTGMVIQAVVLFGIGLSNIFDVSLLLPLILITVGLVILIRSIFGRSVG